MKKAGARAARSAGAGPSVRGAPAGTDLATVLYCKPGHLIRRLQQIAVAAFLDETREFEMTPVQYAALAAIRAYPGIDQLRLANTIGFDRTTIGGVIARLEAKKLITRAVGPVDRRARVLLITAAGGRTLSAMWPKAERAQERILAGLDARERRLFVGMLARLVRINNAVSRVPVDAPSDARPRQDRRGRPPTD